jgi:poly-gamma-glutamate capsule biosynthesis protein CapA/YwtB (metallophosphatase superfamily)
MVIKLSFNSTSGQESLVNSRLKRRKLTLRSVSVASVLLLMLCVCPVLLNHTQDVNAQRLTPPSTLSLIFIGDIMQHMPQVDAAYSTATNTYNYDSCFMFVKPIISRADFAIANLETTFAGMPYSGYPAFSSPSALANSLVYAGIDVLGTANNHCADRGKTGIERTISILDSLGLKHMGTYATAEARARTYPLMLRHSGITVALLNYTYGLNGNPVYLPNVVNMIDTALIRHDLLVARDSMPDKIIIFMHWGTEYEGQPNALQKEIAGFCLRNGADIIIGSHPHVLQPMEIFSMDDSLQKREVMVVWSLGNFVSNQRNRYCDGGAMVRIDLQKNATGTSIQKAGYELTWVYNPIKDGKKRYYILPANTGAANPFAMDSASLANMRQFRYDSRLLFKTGNQALGEW